MSHQPTDLVLAALQNLQANGVRLRASLETCERLRATAKTASPSPHSAKSRGVELSAARVPPPNAPPPQIASTEKRGALSAALHAAMNPAAERAPEPPPVSAVTSEKAAKLAVLRGPVLVCTKCPHLAATRTQVVFGTGNLDAEVMFIGEAPGADEDLVGEPFVGRAGQTLTKMIEAMNFRRSDVYIANILKCRPNTLPGESGNRKPTPVEMKTCEPYLLRQIEIIQPKIIVALGGTAVEGLLGLKYAGITKMRGTWKEFHGIPVMPTLHPSYLLRPGSEQISNKRLAWEDMLAVLERLGHEITQKQRGFFLPR